MGEAAKKKFNQLHLVSVILNFLALIVGLVLIYQSYEMTYKTIIKPEDL